MEVAEHVPRNSSWYLRYVSMMSLYKICRSFLKATLSAIFIRENTVKEEEEGEGGGGEEGEEGVEEGEEGEE